MKDDSHRLVALSIYHCVNDGSLTLFASALPVMRVDLGLSFLEIGTVLSLGLAATMALQLVFGSLSDMGHARPILIAGFSGIVVANLMFPISSSLLQVLIFYVFLRSAAAVYHPVSFSSIGRSYADERTAAFGYQGAIGDLGLAIATFSTGILSEIWRWKIPFWCWGTVGMILCAYFIAAIVRHRVGFNTLPISSANESEDNLQRSSVRSAFAVLATASSTNTATFILFTGYMPLYFNIVGKLSPGESTAVVAAWVGVGVFAGAIAGKVVRRLGGEPRTLQAMFATEVVLFLIANTMSLQVFPTPSWQAIRDAAIVLTGIPVFIAFPAVNGLLGLRMPHRRLGLTYALNLSLGLVLGSVVTYLTGYLASVMTIGVALPMLLFVAGLGRWPLLCSETETKCRLPSPDQKNGLCFPPFPCEPRWPLTLSSWP